MNKKQKEKCRYITNKGVRCENWQIGSSGLCWRHNLKVRFRTQLIIGVIFLALTIVITLFLPDIKKAIIPEKTLIEKIKIEGNHSVKISNKKEASIYSHVLDSLGMVALQRGDFDAYQEAIWQMLRLYEFCLTSDWPNDPTTALVRNEVSDQLLSLITAKDLNCMQYLTQCLGVSEKLGDFALVGTKEDVFSYNKGEFFSDTLFTEGLEIMRRAIDMLYEKENYEYAKLIFGFMQEVLLAEGHRRLDQGYRICPKIDDKLQFTPTRERIADVGQPPELNSFYKACYILSQVPEPMVKPFVENAKYFKLRIKLVEASEGEEEETAPMDELVNRWRYYHYPQVPLLVCVKESGKKEVILDSLLLACNEKGEKAVECVKQLVWR